MSTRCYVGKTLPAGRRRGFVQTGGRRPAAGAAGGPRGIAPPFAPGPLGPISADTLWQGRMRDPLANAPGVAATDHGRAVIGRRLWRAGDVG